jgi:hypothetical protein
MSPSALWKKNSFMFSKDKASYHSRQRISKGSATNANSTDPSVRLIKPLPRQPVTAIERLVVAALGQGNTTTLSSLINRVARDLYIKELAMGAGVLDIGLFGPDLLVHDVSAELSAGNSILWHIENSR